MSFEKINPVMFQGEIFYCQSMIRANLMPLLQETCPESKITIANDNGFHYVPICEVELNL